MRITELQNENNNYESKYIDYTTIHIWIQNWGWFNPSNDQSLSTSIDKVKTYIYEHEKLAIKLNKPVVLEEFGIYRDYNESKKLINKQKIKVIKRMEKDNY